MTYKETMLGTHWNTLNGAGIEGEAVSSAWNYYCISMPQRYVFEIAKIIVILLISIQC